MPPPPSSGSLGTDEEATTTGSVNLGILVPAVSLIAGMVVASVLVMLPLHQQRSILRFVARYIPGCACLHPPPQSTKPSMTRIPSSTSVTDNAGILKTTKIPDLIGKCSHTDGDKQSEGLVEIELHSSPQNRGVRVPGSNSRISTPEHGWGSELQRSSLVNLTPGPAMTAMTLDRHDWGRNTLQVRHHHHHHQQEQQQQKYNRPLRLHPVPSAPTAHPSFETDSDPHGGVSLLSSHSPVQSPATSPGLRPPSRLRFEYFSSDDVDTDDDKEKGVKIQQNQRGKERMERESDMERGSDVERTETPESWVTPWVMVADGARGVRK